MSNPPDSDEPCIPPPSHQDIDMSEDQSNPACSNETPQNNSNAASWWNTIYSTGYAMCTGDSSVSQSEVGANSSQSIPSSTSGSNWLKHIYSSAVDQSTHVWDFMKRDIGEFANVMQCDTRSAAQKTANTVKEKLNSQDATGNRIKAGLSKMMEQVSRSLTVPPDDEGEETLLLHHGNLQPCTDRLTARIQAVQLDPSTYETEPTPREEYLRWMEIFDVDARKPAISDILVSQAEVRALYTRLVPQTLLHRDFWSRYFYRVDKIEEDEERRQSLKKRAERRSREESSSKWEDEWDADDQREESPDSGEVYSDLPTVKPLQTEDPTLYVPDKIAVPDASNAQAPNVDTPVKAPLSGEGIGQVKEHRMEEKGDLVVIKHPGSADTSSGNTSSSNPDHLKDDWDDEFDVEVSEEDIEKAKELAKTMDGHLDDDDRWEEWN